MSLVGNLEDLGLGEILQIVSLSRKSGILALHSRGREGRIVFRYGQVISASSSAFSESLGELLIRKGVIDLARLKEALAVQEREGFKERLGTILAGRYSVGAQCIEDVVREQIENVVYSLFAWAEGSFDFELREDIEAAGNTRIDPLQFMLDQGLNPQFLAMEGTRIADERRHRGESLDDGGPPGGEPPPAEESFDIAFDLAESPSAAPPAPSPLERPLVMVDDDRATLEALAELLKGGGYTVFPFEKSEETLIRIDTLYRQGERPTVLVDMIMPKMDGSGVLGGLELLELIHQNFPDIPVLVMADYHSTDAERKVREMGFPFMMKPRRVEIADPAALEGFAGRFLATLAGVESGEKTAEWSDGVDIGDELRLEMGEDIAPAAARVPQSTGISLLRGMLEELGNPSLGGGIILLVLRFASEFMNRAVIFIVKEDVIVGLGQFGVDDGDGLANARVRNLRIPRDASSLFSRVVDTRLPFKGESDGSTWHRYLLEELGGGVPGEVFLGPIISEGKVVAVLYGDNIPENRPVGDTEALEIFLSQAGMAMERALLQRRLKGKGREEA